MRALWIAVLLCLGAAPATAQEEPRRVLALFDTKISRPELDTEDPIHQLLEMPLNHLGIIVRRHDIRAGPPPADWHEGLRAVLTHFDGTDEPPDWLWPWLENEVAPRGLRVIHVADFGPLAFGAGNKPDPARLQRWFARFGLEYDEVYLPGPLGLTIRMRVHEADPRSRGVFRGPRSLDARNRAWVEVETVHRPGDVRCPVVTGPWGGLALNPWIVRAGGENDDRRWHIDPFPFLRAALGLEGVPAPEPRVLNGRRMFFAHIDGDGFESLSTVRPGSVCGRVMLDEVLKRYPLPFTVSVIVAGLTRDLAVERPTPRMEEARETFRLPNVEIASHTVLHPLDWLRQTRWYEPIGAYAFDPVAEVTESIRFIDRHLVPDGRRCEVMLWSGDATPPKAAIDAAAAAGTWNMNAGVFRWDARTNSVAFVSPWARTFADGTIQVYAGAANENSFEGFYDTMPGAFAHIDTTIERTGAPRILKPANVYFHYYSAERPARLAALRKLLDRWSLREETAPVFASTYCAAVHDALTRCRVIRTERGWRFEDFGRCPSVRLDGETRPIDWSASRGLLGAHRRNGSLYVHLDGPGAELVFTDAPAPWPHVEQANHALRDVVLSEHGVRCTSASHAPRLLVLAGFPPGAAVVVDVDGERCAAKADAQGRVPVDVGGPGSSPVAVLLDPAQ